MLLRWPLSYELQDVKQKENVMPFMDSDRDDVVLAEKKWESKKIQLII